MSMIMEYLQLTVDGFKQLISEYKLLAPVIGILLYVPVCWKKIKNTKEKYFLTYAAGMLVLLLFPVTAVVFLVYQTRFYDYQWVWSFVPLTGILAWGAVTIVCNENAGLCGNAEKHRNNGNESLLRLCGIVAAVLLIFLCGNQGVLRQETTEEAKLQNAGRQILQYMEDNRGTEEYLIWGPAGVMQYIRSHSGEVKLLYGKDMWDAKAGAYDYEAYTAEETACYNWMESVSASHNLYLLETNQATELIYMSLADENQLKYAVQDGVDVIILPSQITPWVERKFDTIAGESKVTVTTEEIGEYTLWMIE